MDSFTITDHIIFSSFKLNLLRTPVLARDSSFNPTLKCIHLIFFFFFDKKTIIIHNLMEVRFLTLVSLADCPLVWGDLVAMLDHYG